MVVDKERLFLGFLLFLFHLGCVSFQDENRSIVCYIVIRD